MSTFWMRFLQIRSVLWSIVWASKTTGFSTLERELSKESSRISDRSKRRVKFLVWILYVIISFFSYTIPTTTFQIKISKTIQVYQYTTDNKSPYS